jgi:hypothetical protein
MNLRNSLVLAPLSVLLTACVTAPQQPLQLSANAISSKDSKVGVAMKALPKVDTQFPGAGCLLCLAAASVANSALTSHTQTLPYEDLPKLKNDVANLLGKKGANVTVIADNIDVEALPSYSGKESNAAKKDFSALKQKYSIDRLVVIEINTLGMERPYSSYIPTNAPAAILQGTGYMVNLSNNTYEWYMPVRITKYADGEWDEPPKFPGLTNAYFNVIENGKDDFLKPFAN